MGAVSTKPQHLYGVIASAIGFAADKIAGWMPASARLKATAKHRKEALPSLLVPE